MKKTELKLYPCYCGGEMEIKKVAQNGGMDGTYWDWKLTCNKCGLTKYYSADGFYGRKYKTFEEVVDDWNNKKDGDCISRQAVLDIFADNADATRPYSTAWKKIRDLPSINPQPKWIPVSKRSPFVGIDVLICDIEGTIYLSHRTYLDDYFDECGNKIKDIRAWMPLPKKYEPQESEVNE